MLKVDGKEIKNIDELFKECWGLPIFIIKDVKEADSGDDLIQFLADAFPGGTDLETLNAYLWKEGETISECLGLRPINLYEKEEEDGTLD